MSDSHHGPSHASPIYKPCYRLYKLHKMDQPTIVTTVLILGAAGFVYLAIPNLLKKTELNGGKSHKTASGLPKLWPWHS